METIRKFNRFELKYLLPYDVAINLQRELRRYMTKDKHGKNGEYTLSSLYYDSEDYRCYWEKIEGLKFRRKLRIRRYVDNDDFNDDSMVFVEIKQRLDRVTQKRRVPMKYGDALRFCNEGIIPVHEKSDLAVIEEIDSMIRLFNLKPKAITTYSRRAFVGSDYDDGLRVTFDTDVSYRKNNLNLAEDFREDYMISPDRILMEIKVNERIPYWITEIVAEHNFRLIRVSKYCQGLETASVVPKSFFHIY